MIKSFKRLGLKALTALIFPLLAALTPLQAGAVVFSNEVLHYTISYKWGLIHKDAGKATLKLSDHGNIYSLLFTARTLPWADKVFMVRDTLKSTVSKAGFKPLSYSKITHEGKHYGVDNLHFSYSGNKMKGTVRKYRRDKKGRVTQSSGSVAGTYPGFDMLSVFYYLRTLDFEKMRSNHVYTVDILSGMKSERLAISCKGVKNLQMPDKRYRSAYILVFTFTQGGKKKSSEDITTYISTDKRHVPLYVVGKLPFGEVRAWLDK